VPQAISVNTLCLAPAPLDRLIDRVARLGVRGISPDLDQVLAFGVGGTARAIRDAGLAVATLTHRSFAFATSAEVEAGQQRLLRTIALAVELGARTITLTTGERGALTWAEAAEHFAAAMAPCARTADQAGVALGLEPTSHLYADVSIAHRLADTITLARKAGIGVTIDLFACWTDADIDAAIAEAGPLTRLVQVSDYVYGDRSLPCRAVPGDGAVPLARLLPAIVRSGFTGWFDIEVIGPRLQHEGEEAGLRRAVAAVGAILAGEGR
jgi:sugar phosphate isomerase/epimerase